MKIYQRRNPDWSFEVLKQYDDAQRRGEKTRGHKFVTLWQQYIEQGMAQEDAYQKVETEFQEVESKLAAELDGLHLKQLRTFSVPSINELEAEEDKYAEQAIAFQRTMWHARKNRSAEAALQAQIKADEPEADEADEDPSAAAAAGKSKRKPPPKSPKKK